MGNVARVLIVFLSLSLAHAAGEAAPPPNNHGLLIRSSPIIVPVTLVPPEYSSGTVTDVEVADYNGDGRSDLAVLWHLTHATTYRENLRRLTVFENTGDEFALLAELDLFDPDQPLGEAWSIFRMGTADLGIGDFDGDGDVDLAASPFFGDEIWFIENLGEGSFAQHLKFPFGWNTAGNLQTPTELIAADFNNDGRDELVVLVDPLQYFIEGPVHFWTTSGSIADMRRLYWTALEGMSYIQYTRGMAVADFDQDGQPDLALTASVHPPEEDDPAFAAWYNLDVTAGGFAARMEYPSLLCSDAVAVHVPGRPPGLLLLGLDGARVQYWEGRLPLDFVLRREVTGYAGLSPDRGMAGVLCDIDGDGDADLVTKQKVGQSDEANQIEITLSSAGATQWTRVRPTPVDTTGLRTESSDLQEILRPRNIAVGDLFGNARPEIAAAFGRCAGDLVGMPDQTVLVAAVWLNSCMGDVTVDGQVTGADIGQLLHDFAVEQQDPWFNYHADLNKDGVISCSDVRIAIGDSACGCVSCGDLSIGDADCDGVVSNRDVNAFAAATAGRQIYEQQYPGCNWLNSDCNGDGSVNWRDIDAFVLVLNCMTNPGEGLEPEPEE